MQSDGIWGLLGTLAIGYIIYRYLSKPKRRKFGVLQGGRSPDGQFQTTANGPPSSYVGNTPQISVLGWPNMGDCKC